MEQHTGLAFHNYIFFCCESSMIQVELQRYSTIILETNPIIIIMIILVVVKMLVARKMFVIEDRGFLWVRHNCFVYFCSMILVQSLRGKKVEEVVGLFFIYLSMIILRLMVGFELINVISDFCSWKDIKFNRVHWRQN